MSHAKIASGILFRFMFVYLKCIIAITASVYGCLQLVGLGLAGTNGQPATEPLLLVLGVSCAAGIATALLPNVALAYVLTASLLPVSYFFFLIILGAIEDQKLPSLLSLVIPFGIVVLITFPEIVKGYRRKTRQEP